MTELTMSSLKIDSEQKLIHLLRLVKEQAIPVAAPAPAAPPPAPVEPAQQPAAGEQPPANEVIVTPDMIIEKLNVVRAGRSTKDPAVKIEIEQYVQQFSNDERTALLAFLEGLGQILTAGIDSSSAPDPADPYALQIQKDPNAPVRAAQPAPAPVAAPVAAVPIQVGG
jgi:hypothetical protein